MNISCFNVIISLQKKYPQVEYWTVDHTGEGFNKPPYHNLGLYKVTTRGTFRLMSEYYRLSENESRCKVYHKVENFNIV